MGENDAVLFLSDSEVLLEFCVGSCQCSRDLMLFFSVRSLGSSPQPSNALLLIPVVELDLICSPSIITITFVATLALAQNLAQEQFLQFD